LTSTRQVEPRSVPKSDKFDVMHEDPPRGDASLTSRVDGDAHHDDARSAPAAQSPGAEKNAGKSIGALYRRMSGWYILFSIALFLFILFVGFQLARPLLPHLLDSGG
jgi:hypothetical protein